MKFLRKIFLLATFAWLIPSVLSILAYYVSPQTHWLPVLFGLGYLPILLVNVLLFLIWLRTKARRYALVPLTAILIGWPQLLSNFSFHFLDSQAGNPSQELRVMSFNVKQFQMMEKSGDGPQKVKRDGAWIKEKPDIICFQEAHRYLVKTFDAVEKELGLKHRFVTVHGVTILSKFPFKKKKFLEFEKTHNTASWVDVEVNGQTIRIFNVHFQSLYFGEDDYDLLNNPNLEEKQQIRSTLRKIARASRLRQKQVEVIMAEIDKSPHPVILCGDFNATPSSYSYYQATLRLNDSFKAKGLGLGATYAGPIPALRIDYIMADDRFRFLSHKIYRKEFSDHYPVIAELELMEVQ